MIKLEFMLCMILFRFNIFKNMFFILNFIRIGGCIVNNIIVTYPYKFIKLNDIVTIHPKYFKKIFNIFNVNMYFSSRTFIKWKTLYRYSLTTPKVLLNIPNYLKANYKILSIAMWRLPRKKEIISLIAFPFSNSLGDWSMSVKMGY
jgi:hypothetical protein